MPGATDNYVGNAGVGGESYASDAIGSVHWPRVKLAAGVNGSATDVTGIGDGGAEFGVGVAQIATHFAPGAGNTSTAQLAAAATFTGTIETIFSQQAISVLLFSDQPGTLTLNQYIDLAGVKKASTISFPIAANVGFSRSFVANGNYANLVFQNTGGATTTLLDINTFYGTLPASTNRGNLPVSVDEIGGVAVVGVVPVQSNNTYGQTARMRAQTFRVPGRAGTAGQKIFALHNATGSTKIVTINALTVDLVATVVKAVTVLPPAIRIHRFTAIPTNGTTCAKVQKDTALSSNASITAWQDASADGTSSGTALTITIPASSMLSQAFAARLITAAGYEPFDREPFMDGDEVILRPLEGIVVFLDYVLATQNPVTDMWLVGCDWSEK